MNCFGGVDWATEESILAAADELAVFEDGSVDVALSPTGCLRFAREVDAGKLVRSSLRYVSATFNETTFEIETKEALLGDWTRDADGVLHGRIDDDDRPAVEDDDFFEVEETSDPGAVRFERVHYNAASHEVDERWALFREADGRLRQTREALRDGVLTLVEDFHADERHMRCGDGPTDCAQKECDDATKQRLEDLSKQALARLFACQSDRGANPGARTARSTAQLGTAWNSGHSFKCFDGPCGQERNRTVGAWWADCQAEGAPLGMTVDASRTDAELMRTIGHELSHGSLGLHTPATIALVDAGTDIATQRLAYSDPAYACERYCFGDNATDYMVNSCSCAACLDVSVCDEPCRQLPSCHDMDDGIGDFVAENVGSTCTDTNWFSDDVVTWYDDFASCEAGCDGDCQSFSRSCDPSCK